MKKSLYILGVLMIALITGCNNTKKQAENKQVCVDTTLQAAINKIDTSAQNKTVETNPSDKSEQLKTGLPKVILLTTSEGCKCTLEKCSAGEKTVKDYVSQSQGKITFEKFDYIKEQDATGKLAEKYGVTTIPALLFFDKQGNFTGKLETSWDEKAIKEKLGMN
ncbi:MAG: hypothetical protein PHX21_01120 [bacterium]|nr:hypothetical protein [bacterium]